MNFDELIRYTERRKKGFNLIGFSNSDPVKYKHCIFCAGRRLQPDPHDDSKLMCFSCGYSILAHEAPNEEGVSVKHVQQTTIISGKGKKKKYYDKQGNLITDETLKQDIQQGANVISYREEVPK